MTWPPASLLSSGAAIICPPTFDVGPEDYSHGKLFAGSENCVVDSEMILATGGLWRSLTEAHTLDSAPVPSIVADVGFSWQELVYTGAAGDSGKEASWETDFMTGFSVGNPASLSVTLKGTSANTTWELLLSAYTSAGALISSETTAITPSAGAQVWTATTASLPATTSKLKAKLVATATSDATAFDVEVSRFVLTRTAYAVPWFYGPAGASRLSYPHGLATLSQGTIIGRFVPFVAHDDANWVAPAGNNASGSSLGPDSVVTLAKGPTNDIYAVQSGLSVGYWTSSVWIALVNSYVSNHDYVGVHGLAFDAMDECYFAARWEDGVGLDLWFNGVKDSADHPFDRNFWSYGGLVEIGQQQAGAYPAKCYAGPFVISSTAKALSVIGDVNADSGAILDDLDALWNDVMDYGDIIMPLDAENGTTAYRKCRPSRTSLVLFDGNSITHGNPGVIRRGVQDVPTVCADALDGDWVRLTPLYTGMQTSENIANAATYHDPQAVSGYTSRICVFSEATNALNGSKTPAQELADWHIYCDARRAAGFEKIVVWTMLPSSDTTRNNNAIAGGFASWEDKRTQFNTLLRANYAAFADLLVDVGADAIMGDAARCNDGVYYNDTTHPSALGSSIIAGLIADAITATWPLAVSALPAPIDTTAVRSDIELWAGDTAPLVQTIPCDLAGSLVSWVLAAAPGYVPLVTKTPTISDAVNGEITVFLDDTDTATLSGFYYYEAEVTDGDGYVKTLLYGQARIHPDTA